MFGRTAAVSQGKFITVVYKQSFTSSVHILYYFTSGGIFCLNLYSEQDNESKDTFMCVDCEFTLLT